MRSFGLSIVVDQTLFRIVSPSTTPHWSFVNCIFMNARTTEYNPEMCVCVRAGRRWLWPRQANSTHSFASQFRTCHMHTHTPPAHRAPLWVCLCVSVVRCAGSQCNLLLLSWIMLDLSINLIRNFSLFSVFLSFSFSVFSPFTVAAVVVSFQFTRKSSRAPWKKSTK